MRERPSENSGVAMKSDLSFSDGLSDNSSNSTQRAVGLPEMLDNKPIYYC